MLQVFVACLTPRYLASHYCARELLLADVLRKPILPVIVDHVPWPPPGPLCLALASLCYVDLKGETLYAIYNVVCLFDFFLIDIQSCRDVC